MIKILTLIGLILQFISFWLAAPEILGPDWIVKTEDFFRKLIRKIPTVVLSFLGAIIGVIFYQSIRLDTILILVMICIIFILLLIFHKQIEYFLDHKISNPLIQKLIISNNFRFTLLKFAAIFFTIGFIIQIFLVIIS
ncbi:hypothetical protein [Faecalibacter sp. LW9]|uniref:hypothetical protein n=1 Tax=Faecalibacter sp. LW9 TaxID=3103144 RepID=UPI002AFE7371|nr:hypothetical protein [Faecalibacter sp. LW9]